MSLACILSRHPRSCSPKEAFSCSDSHCGLLAYEFPLARGSQSFIVLGRSAPHASPCKIISTAPQEDLLMEMVSSVQKEDRRIAKLDEFLCVRPQRAARKPM